MGFEETSFDESSKAKYMSDFLGIKNEKFIINDKDLKDIEKIVLGFGEPLADTSIIPTYFLSKFASKQVKVCLGGDGGDELFLDMIYTLANVLILLINISLIIYLNMQNL